MKEDFLSLEKKAREEIKKLVTKYYQNFHDNADYSFKKGDRINYSAKIFDNKELEYLVDSSLDFWLTQGKYTNKFETKLSAFLNIKYCSFVNSGSSANLLAFMALTSPLLGERSIKRGDEVITVAACFPTTVAPIVQFGAIPVFVDITIPQYNIDCNKLESALSNKTKAVFLAHTLGNPFDLKKVKEFCTKNNLWLIEDNCDSLGSTYNIDNKSRYTGTIGDIGTSSFYPPHHITTGEGGAVYTDNPLLSKIIRSMRDWGRDCICDSGEDNLCNSRFEKQYGLLPFGYDHKYTYSHFGYNLKATDLQAAIGVIQLDKLNSFIKKRKENFDLLKQNLSVLEDKLILPEASFSSDPSWFGFIITCKNKNDRLNLVRKLEDNNIQTRMLFSGNITKHPCFDFMEHTNSKYRIIDNLDNTDITLTNTFWIGVYPGLSKDMIDFMSNCIIEYFS